MKQFSRYFQYVNNRNSTVDRCVISVTLHIVTVTRVIKVCMFIPLFYNFQLKVISWLHGDVTVINCVSFIKYDMWSVKVTCFWVILHVALQAGQLYFYFGHGELQKSKMFPRTLRVLILFMEYYLWIQFLPSYPQI